ncbi:MAG: alpha amylase C-terminal domain-containing protein, partial [Chloroflexota bacterium]
SENSVFSYVRYSKEEQEAIVVVLNFTPMPRLGYRIGVPKAGHYDELLNSDADIYGGSNVGNMGGVDSQAHPAHGFDQSISLALPPLGALVFKYND